MTGIAVVGSLNEDLVVEVVVAPAAGETVLARGHQRGLGGKGANQAVAAARLGGRVHLTGCVGDDAGGNEFRRRLAAERIDTTGIRVRDGGATGLAVIVVDRAGENRILVSAGSNATLGQGDLSEGALATASVVLAQLEVPADAVLAAFRMAAGRRILNAAPAAPVSAELLELVDILVVNETELASITGRGIPESPHEALAQAGVVTGPETVVVTLGGSGCVVLTSGESWHEPGRTVPVVDTTAAGDAFCGALAVRLSVGDDLRSAVRYATRVGAAVVTRRGAIDSLPTLTELDDPDEGWNA
ncbi:ribokinase [Occultella glacieicola]|uniref:Ribokinase n=1 Tax=Occultella glacieicola TaxID=2518684 RepID=A0ABY2E4R4_9MICO|nr:ribokinase [Occultella glacieicola]TDE95006.1 ribokinase [Occultella glacieicola]